MTPFSPWETAPPGGSSGWSGLRRRPLPLSPLRYSRLAPAHLSGPCSMWPLRLDGTSTLCQRPLLLLLLLLPPLTGAQTTPGTPNAPTTPATSSTPSLRERARALMQDFPLVDGFVSAVWRQVETEPILRHEGVRAPKEVLSHHPWMRSPIIHGCLFPSSFTPSLVGTPLATRGPSMVCDSVVWGTSSPPMLATYPA